MMTHIILQGPYILSPRDRIFYALKTVYFQLKTVYFQRDTCSWKGQLEKTRSWKDLSWKVRYEIGKNEVGKFAAKLESSG